jgi:hypothetical protein
LPGSRVFATCAHAVADMGCQRQIVEQSDGYALTVKDNQPNLVGAAASSPWQGTR